MASRIGVGLLGRRRRPSVRRARSGLGRRRALGLVPRLDLGPRWPSASWPAPARLPRRSSAFAGGLGSHLLPTYVCPGEVRGAVGRVRSEKSSQSARSTSWAESSPKVVVCAWGRLANERSTSISSWASDDQDGAVQLELAQMVAASLVLGPSIFQSSTTRSARCPPGRSRAESRARRTIFLGCAARSCAASARGPRHHRSWRASGSIPGGPGRCPSGGTAWRRRRVPRPASRSTGSPPGSRPAGR